jgi:hypothetical protein
LFAPNQFRRSLVAPRSNDPIVCSDWGNVFTGFKFRLPLVREILGKAGYPTNINFGPIFGHPCEEVVEGESYYHALDIGEFTVNDIWNRLAQNGYIERGKLSYHQFCKHWCDGLTIFDEVGKFYQRLSRRYSFVFISNCDAVWEDYLTKVLLEVYGIRPLQVFGSARHREVKPPLMTKVASYLREIGTEPKKCAYVDDLLGHLLGAHSEGLQIVQFDARKQPVSFLEGELRKCGFYCD